MREETDDEVAFEYLKHEKAKDLIDLVKKELPGHTNKVIDIWCYILCEAYLGDGDEAIKVVESNDLDESNVYAFMEEDEALQDYLNDRRESYCCDANDYEPSYRDDLP